MSEETLNQDTSSEENRVRVIVEMEEGLVTAVHANAPGVEVIVLESIGEDTDPSDRTAVEYNGSVVEYVVATYTPDDSRYDYEWERAILAGIHARAEEDAVA